MDNFRRKGSKNEKMVIKSLNSSNETQSFDRKKLKLGKIRAVFLITFAVLAPGIFTPVVQGSPPGATIEYQPITSDGLAAGYPFLVVDGVVKAAGKVPKPEEIKEWIE
jgi:hypothetical protein